MLSTKIPLRFFVETVLPNHKYIAVRHKNGIRAGVNCKHALLRLKKEIPLNHNYDLNGVTDLISWSPIQLQEYISIKLPNSGALKIGQKIFEGIMKMGSTQAVNLSDKIRLKLPRKRLFRTNSIAKEFRDRGFYFEWFSKNSISFEIPKKELRESKRVVYLTGSLVCYKVRVDVWYFANDHNFQYYEIIEPHGRALLFALVELQILPPSFLPSITPYHSKLNQL